MKRKCWFLISVTAILLACWGYRANHIQVYWEDEGVKYIQYSQGFLIEEPKWMIFESAEEFKMLVGDVMTNQFNPVLRTCDEILSTRAFLVYLQEESGQPLILTVSEWKLNSSHKIGAEEKDFVIHERAENVDVYVDEDESLMTIRMVKENWVIQLEFARSELEWMKPTLARTWEAMKKLD